MKARGLSLSIVVFLACGPAGPGEAPADITGGSESGAPATTEPATTDALTTTAATTTATSGISTMPGLTTTAPGDTTSGSGVDTSSGSGEETCNFICGDDADTDGCDDLFPLGDGMELRLTLCDTFLQDCPEGEKCAPATKCSGQSWTTTCVPVTGDGAPGDACTAEAGSTGVDDCRKGSMCWNVDAETGLGTCVDLCIGDQNSPVCADEAEFKCAVLSDGVLNLCLPACDPLVQECALDELCVPVGDAFVCSPDASGEGGQTFDPCEFANACDAGQVCFLESSAATECHPDAGGCCLPFCDLSDPNVVCPGAGLSCVPFHEEGAPPEYMNVGVCMIAS